MTIHQVENRRWTAVHVRARCEKTVRSHCESNDVPCYLPLLRKVKRFQRRTVTTYVPMFSGYVFVQLDADLRDLLLRCSKVVHILPVDDIAETILVEELNALLEMEKLSEERDVAIHPEIVPGKSVKLCGGPLAGASGVVSRRDTTVRVTVNVEMLGQSVSVTLDVGEVEVDEG